MHVIQYIWNTDTQVSSLQLSTLTQYTGNTNTNVIFTTQHAILSNDLPMDAYLTLTDVSCICVI